MADYAFTPLELARMDRVTRSKALALGREVERLRGQVARVEALHAGTHQCAGAWWTDDPTYRGTVAYKAPCPTRAALAEPEATS